MKTIYIKVDVPDDMKINHLQVKSVDIFDTKKMKISVLYESDTSPLEIITNRELKKEYYKDAAQKLFDDGFIDDRMAWHSLGVHIEEGGER